MLSALRRSLNTWVVRAFFLVLVAAFALWGIGDVLRMGGTETWVAKVGDQTIEPPALQQVFRAALARYARDQHNAEPTAAVREQLAGEALQNMILRAAVDAEVRRLHIVVPDAMLRQSVFAIPAFQGTNGAFDRQVFETVLRNNGMTEAQFLDLQRGDLARRELLEPVRAGVTVPDLLTRQAFDFAGEQRAADMVEFPFDAVPAPPAPDQAVLTRWYDNHPWLYSTPELRRIKVVVLSPETVAKDVPITDAELHAAYDQLRQEYVTPAKRSVQVIQTPDEAKAKALAAQWRAGADWTAMQAAAKADGATAVELDDASAQEFPVPELAKAVFAAAPQTVPDPVHSPLGWHVLRVIAETPGTERSFDQVKDELRRKVLAERATDVIYDRANKLDNILGTGASLDELPSDLGLAAVTGTLDAQGDTADGKPAPIPGPPALRAAIIAAAFKLQKNEPPHLVEVPTPQEGGSAYYAMTVEAIDPPKVKPYADVHDQVLADWRRDAVEHAQNTAAANLLAAIDKGQSIGDAALVAGVTMRRSPLVDRSRPTEGMPPALQRVLFGMKKGEATEVETPDGFVTAVLTEIKEPDPKQDAAAYAAVRDKLNHQTADDVEQIFADALRARAAPQVNQAALQQIAQP